MLTHKIKTGHRSIIRTCLSNPNITKFLDIKRLDWTKARISLGQFAFKSILFFENALTICLNRSLAVYLHTGNKNKKEMEDTNKTEDLQDQQQKDYMEGNQVTENIANEAEMDPLMAITKQLDEQKDKFLRLFAEFDNYKKRMAKERLELLSTAGKEIILDFLPIADDMERSMKASATTDDIQIVREGFALITEKIMKTLEKKGVKPIEAIGQTFDSEKHEAITEIPAPTEELKGKIVDEIEKGYTMHDKIIRFSKVVVGK